MRGWDPSWVTTCFVGRRLQGAQPGICVAGSALRLVPPTDDMAPGGRLGAMRSGVALGLSPAGRPPPALTVEGRSMVPALDPDRANAVPGRYAEVTSFGVSPPDHG
jgi:hypothetical protein